MKKIISMLLVLAMVITVLTVGMTATSAAETATITIYGLDGTTKVKEVSVGDEFTVYSTLNVSASAANGRVGSVQGTQTYSSDVLTLVDEVSGQYGEFVDLVKVFPVTGETTMANGAQTGKIVYNASTPSTTNGFKFDSDSSLLIVTTYKVTAAGAGEVKNALKNLAAADEALTRIVFEGEVQSGKTVAGKASFEDPTPTIDHAEVRIHSLNGSVETKSFNIGDTFTAYTFLDASSVNSGLMASVNGIQRYTSTVLELADVVDSEGLIENTAKVFPIMKDSAIANAKNAGVIKYSGSSISGFSFNSAQSQLIATTYKVTANGYADITNKLNVLGAADDDITRIVFNGELQDGVSYSMTGSFNADNPAPTDPPKPTDPISNKLKVTIVNPDNTTEVKEFSVGDTFTVYTVLNAGTTIASVDGTQTYPTASLQLTDAVTGEYNEVVNKTAMFPILGDEVVAAANNGAIKFNASRGAINGGYAFNTATSKLIVTNYKVLATGEATIKTTLKALIKDDADASKIVFNGTTQSGQSYSMPGSFIDPSNPVQPTDPPKPTETQPEPTQPDNKAVVTIYGLDGTSRTKTFNIGDTFTVYTTLDASKFGLHGIGSISASQTFTESVLQSTDEVDELSVVVNTEEMFPILGAGTVAKIADGLNKYNASTPGINKGFVFDNANALLLVTNYKVTAAGNAEVRNSITTMAGDDADLTKIVMKGVVQDGFKLAGIASFYDPSQPEPTEPPVQTADVTIYGIDGTSETKTFNIGDTFTVYTTFDASKASSAGIASLSATQTFTSSVLKNTDTVDSASVITDNTTVFPVLKDSAVGRVSDGLIKYNGSTPGINNGFVFGENSLLIVSHYTVIAGGKAEVRNSLTTVAAADADLTRIVDKGEVKDGVTLSGIASFTDPSAPIVPTQPAEKYLFGDADSNNAVDSLDVTVLQRAIAHMSQPSIDKAIMNRNGDINSSGDIEIIDVTLIQRHLAHLKTDYPIGEYIEVK